MDSSVSILSYQSFALWLLGYPGAALANADDTLKKAREIGQAATLMRALDFITWPHIWCGNYAAANAVLDELVALSDEKGASLWKAFGMMNQGWLLVSICKTRKAVQMITLGIAAWRSTGSTPWISFHLSHLARAHAELRQFEEAWHCIGEAMSAVETIREKWCEAEVHRTAGEIALMPPAPEAAKAEAHFEHALTIARQQQAKSWELRVAMSMARLWLDQDKRQQAHDLLAPVYGWFTEGFDTLDLKEAKALLEQLKP
jgi:predicted ATPase